MEQRMEKVAILDCGGQYTKVIDRKVRELGVYTDIFPLGVEGADLASYQAVILSGGPSSVWAESAPPMTRRFLSWASPCWEFATVCS